MSRFANPSTALADRSSAELLQPMRITLDIPTERTAEVLRYLAALMPAAEEPQADPAPGHPELPLPEMPVATLKGLVNLPAKKFHFLDETDARLPVIAAADPLKVAMDDPVEAQPKDPTRREFPWGELPQPPPLPEGKTRWVNRGAFLKNNIPAIGRKVAFLDAEGTWRETFNFSTVLPHIEAI